MKISTVVFIILTLFLSCSNSEDHKTKAREYFDENDFPSALTEINKVISAEPDSVDNYLFRMMIYDQSGMFNEEKQDINKIISLDKNNIHAYHQRAYVNTLLGFYNEALLDIDFFIENVDSTEDLTEVYINKASIYYSLNEKVNAREYYLLALEENSGISEIKEIHCIIGLANRANASNYS